MSVDGMGWNRIESNITSKSLRSRVGVEQDMSVLEVLRIRSVLKMLL